MSRATTSVIRVGISLPKLDGRPAAVEHDCRAGHERGLVGGQVDSQVGHFVWSAHAPDGLARVQLFDGFLTRVAVKALDITFDERTVHRARADGVAADAR